MSYGNVEECSNMASGGRGNKLGILALVGAIVSTLLYYAASDGIRFLVKAILSGGRNLMVGA
jgi:hypothetical protein